MIISSAIINPGILVYMVKIDGETFKIPPPTHIKPHNYTEETPKRFQVVTWEEVPEYVKQHIVNIEETHQIGIHKRKYIMTPQDVIKSTQVSWKAKGLFFLILNNQKIFSDVSFDKQTFLEGISKEGPEAISSGLRELKQIGVFEKRMCRNKHGNAYCGSEWILTTK